MIPPSDPLVANMPLGRDIYLTKHFAAPNLDEDTLARMRAPPDADEMDDDGDSSSDEATTAQSGLPGAFPGSSSAASKDQSYF